MSLLRDTVRISAAALVIAGRVHLAFAEDLRGTYSLQGTTTKAHVYKESGKQLRRAPSCGRELLPTLDGLSRLDIVHSSSTRVNGTDWKFESTDGKAVLVHPANNEGEVRIFVSFGHTGPKAEATVQVYRYDKSGTEQCADARVLKGTYSP